MRYALRPPSRRLVPALAAAGLAALALPLMAPTCQPTTPGVKTFSKRSIVIPMDRCYQGDGGAPNGCDGATGDAGNVLQAYGVVYQLIKNNIPVYWVIKQTKASLTDVDLTVQLDGGAPVGVYNWTAPGSVGGMPPNNTTFVIDYRGGPFVVDGSDYDAVVNLFQNGNAATNTPALRTLYSAVKVHVSQVAFQGYAAKTFAGGWNAGGTVAPPIALLDICGGDNIYAEAVIQGYLTNAGLDFAGAGGNATDTGHGQIYDRLFASDFIPPTCTGNATCQAVEPTSTCNTTAGRCDWRATNLYKYGYRILWAPHWEGLNSYASTAGCSGSRLPNQSDIDPIIKTIGAFVSAGHDLMSECASIGSLEGVYQVGTANPVTPPGGTCSGSTNCFGIGSAESRFQTTGTGAFPGGGGMYINEAASGGTTVGTFNSAFYPSPFLQIGDFPYTPVTGAIDSFRPAAANGSVTYRTGVSTLISNNAGVDYFTLLPAPPSAGVVVYLSGHDYRNQIAGTRLVLNTLFNLGAGCVETLAPCNTGQLGVCAEGEMRCVSSVPTCVQKNQPSAEVCDGLDNDCNGAVDDMPSQQTYSYTPGPGGPPGPGCTLVSGAWQCLGLCHPGVSACVFPPPGVTPVPSPGTVVPLTVVSPPVTPVPEDCNGLDDDCDGAVDSPLAARSCYDGPPGTQGVGTCRGGTQTCTAGSWGVCDGEALPLGYDVCEPATDTNCNGAVGDGCGCYPPGSTRLCYGGPAGTENVGACRAGTQTCGSNGILGACVGEVRPGARACNGLDNDCDGVVDTEQMCCDGGAPAT
ncbi:MAG TPA: MopE-related protein, partial [Anaeromyxobacteraceae bacterium]|nr:MopE-related protein [Anaeromyxobacteraceae bacterium]